jgi:hypothetical protein
MNAVAKATKPSDEAMMQSPFLKKPWRRNNMMRVWRKPESGATKDRGNPRDCRGFFVSMNR